MVQKTQQKRNEEEDSSSLTEQLTSSSVANDNGDDNDDVTMDASLFDRLPMELLEMVLMRSFVSMFANKYTKSLSAGQATYSSLGSVSGGWRQTMKGWPQSDTRRWFKHQLRQQLHDACRPYHNRPKFVADLPTAGKECAVAHLNQYIYVSWRFTDTIHVFQDSAPYEWQRDIRIPGIDPRCIAACRTTQHIYILDWRNFCVFKIRKDGSVGKFGGSDHLSCPKSLSVTSSRLLVVDDKKLNIFGAEEDNLLKTVTLPDNMEAEHAMETSRGTYIISHNSKVEENGEWSKFGCVSEVDGEGSVLKAFDGSRLNSPYHVAMDPQGRIFVADFGNKRVLMLNSDLELQKVVVGEGESSTVAATGDGCKPWRLCYVGRVGQLMVCNWLQGVSVYNLR